MFYGWKLAFLGFLGNLMVQGGGVYIMNALIEPLCELHGWTRGMLGTSLAIGSLAGMLSISFFSSLALHIPLRFLMAFGALLGSIGFYGLGNTSSIQIGTLSLCCLWVGGQACGGAIANALMSNWFIKNRGKAFGIVNMGTSMSGAILPILALLLLNYTSVKTATTIFAVITFALLPVALLFVKETPESLNLSPDGISRTVEKNQAKQNIIPWKKLIRMKECYQIGIIFGFGLMVVAGVVGQLKPRFSDLGFSQYTAMALMALTAFCAALGKYIWGWVADKLPPITTTRLIIICTIIGLLFAFLPPSLPSVLIFAVYTGSCVGGFWTVLPAVTAAVFGRSAFVSVYRFLSLFVVMKSLGYYVMGFSYDLTQSYDAGFIFFIVCLVVAMFLTIGLSNKTE